MMERHRQSLPEQASPLLPPGAGLLLTNHEDVLTMKYPLQISFLLLMAGLLAACQQDSAPRPHNSDS